VKIKSNCKNFWYPTKNLSTR